MNNQITPISIVNVEYTPVMLELLNTSSKYIVETHEFGALKHGNDSWKIDPEHRKASVMSTLHSLYRHLMAISINSTIDNESKKHHFKHVLCRLHMLITVVYNTIFTLGIKAYSNREVIPITIPKDITGVNHDILITGEFRYVVNKVFGNTFGTILPTLLTMLKLATPEEKDKYKLFLIQYMMQLVIECMVMFNKDNLGAFKVTDELNHLDRLLHFAFQYLVVDSDLSSEVVDKNEGMYNGQDIALSEEILDEVVEEVEE